MGYVEIDPKIIKKITDITMTDCEAVYEKFLKAENIQSIFEDFIVAYEAKCEELEDVIRDRDDNYRQLTNGELYDCDEIQ